jgi:hypothetical protein
MEMITNRAAKIISELQATPEIGVTYRTSWRISTVNILNRAGG